MNLDEAAKRACQEPTLIKALAWIAVWEMERARTYSPTTTAWDTYFARCFTETMRVWNEQRDSRRTDVLD